MLPMNCFDTMSMALDNFNEIHNKNFVINPENESKLRRFCENLELLIQCFEEIRVLYEVDGDTMGIRITATTDYVDVSDEDHPIYGLLNDCSQVRLMSYTPEDAVFTEGDEPHDFDKVRMIFCVSDVWREES